MSPATAKTDHIDFKTIFAGAIFAGGLVWAAHVEISKIDDRLAALDKHISRVEQQPALSEPSREATLKR